VTKLERKRGRLKGRSSEAKSRPGMALIPEEVMNSPAYLRLPIHARHLLTEISTQYRPIGAGNNGSLCLAYDQIFEPRGWKRTKFYESKDTLAEAGFIVMTRKGGNRHAGYCALAWRNIDPPLPKVGSYDPGITIGSRPSKPWVKSIADLPSLAKKLAVADEAITSGSKKRGAATRHVNPETCRHMTRSVPIEAVNVPPHGTREPVQPSETCRQPAPSKNLCHGQGVSAARGGGKDELVVVESELAHIAEAKTACPVFTHGSNVIPLTVAGYFKRPQTTAAEFRELLIVGGITPEKADARIREAAAVAGEFGAVQFMRKFIADHDTAIREARKAVRTSGRLASAVKKLKLANPATPEKLAA